MSILKNKKILCCVSAILIVCMCLPMFMGATSAVNIKNNKILITQLSTDGEWYLDGTTDFGLSGEYYDIDISHTLVAKWYTNSTNSYTGATQFGDTITLTSVPESSLDADDVIPNTIDGNGNTTNCLTDVGFRFVADLSELSVGEQYIFCELTDGTEVLKTYIRSVNILNNGATETVGSDGTVVNANRINLIYNTVSGVFATSSIKVGDKFDLIDGLDFDDTLLFIGWQIDNKQVTNNTICTQDMVVTDENDVMSVTLTAMYKDLADSDTQYSVTYKQEQKFLGFIPTYIDVTTKAVYLNQSIPDISLTLPDNFSYYSFDKSGKDIVPDDFKVTKDVTVYLNYKGSINDTMFTVKYMTFANGVDLTKRNYGVETTRLFSEDTALAFDVDVNDVTKGGTKYYFSYWSYDIDGRREATIEDTVTKDLTLYAQYSDKKVVQEKSDTFIAKCITYFSDIYLGAGCPKLVASAMAVMTLILCAVLLVMIIFGFIKKLLF